MKKYSTKEGSKYEDLGLMATMHDFMTQIYKSTFEEVGSLNRILIKYGFKDKAKSLQEKALKLEAELKESESVVWNPKWVDFVQDESVKFGAEATTEDIVNRATQSSGYKPELSILEPKYRFPPQIRPTNDWKLQMLY